MKRLESPIRIFLFKLVRINRSSCKSDCFSWSEAIGFMRVWLYGNIKFQNFLTKSTSCIRKSGRLPSYLSYYEIYSRCPARSSIALRNPLYLRLGGVTPLHTPPRFSPLLGACNAVEKLKQEGRGGPKKEHQQNVNSIFRD